MATFMTEEGFREILRQELRSEFARFERRKRRAARTEATQGSDRAQKDPWFEPLRLALEQMEGRCEVVSTTSAAEQLRRMGYMDTKAMRAVATHQRIAELLPHLGWARYRRLKVGGTRVYAWRKRQEEEEQGSED